MRTSSAIRMRPAFGQCRRDYQWCASSVQQGTPYLVRVFVDIAGNEETVVTVYKTSKIAKYWRES